MSMRLTTLLNTSRTLLTGLILTSLLLPAGGRAQPSEPINQIVAVVNDDVVLATELTDEIRKVAAQMAAKGTMPPQHVLARQVLEKLIIQRLQLEQAERNGIRIADESLNRAVNAIARQNRLTLTQLRATLEADGLDYAGFREQIREQMAMRQLRQRQVNNRVNITDQEVDRFLQTQAGRDDNTEYRLYHILIALPRAASPAQVGDAKEKADALVETLQAGADFATTAIENSDGQQALSGGDLGWRTAARVPSLFTEQVAAMDPGDISDPIRSASGYHILELADQRSGGERYIVTQYRARHILIKPTAVLGAAQVRERLERIKTRLENGDDFGELAKAHSEDTGSALNGGELDWAAADSYVPRFAQTLTTAVPNAISEPFESAYGWHILQVLETRTVDQTDEVIRDRARKELTKQKVEEETDLWLRRLRDEAYVELRIGSDRQ